MVTRRISVILDGTSSGLVKAFEQGSQAADKMADRVRSAGRHVEANEQAYTRAGQAITAFGLATTAAVGASAAAAVSWESSFAGVKKTVDDTAEGYAELSGELRGMATELPASHSAIAGVAEAAGQLGIQRENISSFTKTMVDLGETTNLSADEAATSLARFSNIMGTSQDEVSNLGSTIVELGNNYATTEAEIVSMGLRLAGAGRQAGLTEGEVLGLATALSSVGIEAEAGGTAFSRVIIDMGVAVDTQGAKLQTFAEVSGMSAQQFSTAWKEDAGSAIAAFISGLGEMEASGQSVQPVLTELDMDAIRVGDALRRASAASGMFTQAMDTGNTAYAENLALTKEAEQRYATTASKLAVFKNNVVDTGISMGETFLPALNAAAEAGVGTLQWVSELPAPLRDIASWTGAAAGGTALLAGSLLMVAPRAMETYRAFEALGVVGPRTAGAIRGVSSALMGPWGIALAGAIAAIGFFAAGQARAKARADELRDTLDAQTGAITDNTRAWVAQDLQDRGITETYADMGGNLRDLTLAIEGDDAARRRVIATTEEWAASNDRAASSTGGLGVNLSDASIVSAGFVAQLDALGVEMDLQGQKTRELAELQADSARSAESLAAESARLTAQHEAHTAAMRRGIVEQEAYTTAQERAVEMGDEAADAYAKWAEGVAQVTGSFIDYGSAVEAGEEKGVAAAEAQAEAYRQWAADTESSVDEAKASWQTYYDEQDFNLQDFLGKLEEQVAAQVAWEQNLLILSTRMSSTAIQALMEMGPAGKQAAAALVDGTAEELARFEAAAEAKGQAHGERYAAGLADSTEVLTAVAKKWGEDVMAEVAVALATGETTIAQVVDDYELHANINVGGSLAEYEAAIADGLAIAAEADAVVPIDGDSRPAEERIATLEEIVEASTPSIKVDAQDDLAQGVRLGLLEDVNTSTGTVGVDANDNLARQVHALLLARIASSGSTVGIDANATAAYGTLQWFLSQIPRTVTIALAAMPGPMSLPGLALGAIPGRADGGPISGRGGPRDDGILIRASNGEHMLTAAEVDAAGGHDEVYRLRKALIDGQLRYDIGGPVGQPRADRTRATPTLSAPPMYLPPPPAPAAPVQQGDTHFHVETPVPDPRLVMAEASWYLRGER